jgi:O-acetyl-ADP-ribose deacetylase (regulator of RNase III)/Tfp pilus assembly protein PilF
MATQDDALAKNRDVFAKTLRMEETQFGSSDPRLAETLKSLGETHAALGEHRDAVQSLERALELTIQHSGRDSLEASAVLHSLGNAHGDLGDHATKRDLLERALDNYTEDDAAVAQTAYELALAHGELGDDARKKQLLERALSIEERDLGRDHADLAITLMHLGQVYATTGEHAKRVVVLERALAIEEREYGPAHADLVASLNNTGVAYSEIGDHERALTLFSRALAIEEREDTVDSSTLHNVGGAYFGLQNYEEASHVFDRALELDMDKHGEKGAEIVASILLLGSAHEALEELHTAYELYQHALAICGEDHPSLEACREALARVAPPDDGLVDGLVELDRHALKHGELVVSSGSVVDAHVSAIVNAANEKCLGGSGVDGAITKAGGTQLAEARNALPVSDGKRCATGGAVLTTGQFGALRCACVIHAVGPDYRRTDLKKGDALLRSAYGEAMRLARDQDCSTVAFSLLSAGIFRGKRSLEDVLHIAVEALRDACFEGLDRVHLVAFSDEEQEVLQRVAAAPPAPSMSSEEEYACEKGCGFTGSFGDVEKHEKTCAYEPPAPVRTPRPVTPPRILPPITPEPDWAKIATAARSKVEMLEARVRALERASPSKSRYYDSSDESSEEEFFYTRTPYTTKKLPPLETLPARSLSAALRRGRPLRRDDYERRSLWQMLK